VSSRPERIVFGGDAGGERIAATAVRTAAAAGKRLPPRHFDEANKPFYFHMHFSIILETKCDIDVPSERIGCLLLMLHNVNGAKKNLKKSGNPAHLF
jgi:hypothetical protein